MPQPSKAQAAFQTLREVAKAAKKDVNKVTMRYFLERFMDRVFNSEYADKFVMKGGLLMMLAEDCGPLQARNTTDFDVQAPGYKGSIEEFKDIMVRILARDSDDGVVFDITDLKVAAVRDANVPGGSLTVMAYLGATKMKVKCDVTFDDRSPGIDLVREQVPSIIPGQAPVPMRRIPFEHVVADKVQALVRHGAVSYRMRDYYDLYVILTKDKAPNMEETVDAMRRTFDLFGTAMPASVDDIEALSDFDSKRREKMWADEKKARGFWVETPSFPEMVRVIKEHVGPLIEAAQPGLKI